MRKLDVLEALPGRNPRSGSTSLSSSPILGERARRCPDNQLFGGREGSVPTTTPGVSATDSASSAGDRRVEARLGNPEPVDQ